MSNRTCKLDGLCSDLHTKFLGKSVIPDVSWKQSFNKADGQKPKSVIFLGFESEYKLTKDQIYDR